MSNTGIESNTHTATRLDDDDPVPGQDSPAHDIYIKQPQQAHQP
jgi:hypothetical protein